MLSENVKKEVRKFALKNATDYGKADSKAVLNRTLAANPKLRDDIRELTRAVEDTVKQVNALGAKELEKEFAPYAKEFAAREREKEEKSAKPKMELEGAVFGKFATRFAPEPNGYMQLGHAKIAWLGRELTDVYKGNFALYFDDTNPEKEKQEYVEGFKRDLEWLGIRYDRNYYSSDHIEALYKYAEKLMDSGNAYVCLCEGERINKLRFEGKECEHRKHTKAKNLELWKKMLSGEIEENGAVVRLKTQMDSENTAMRDPVLLRVIHHEHYKQGSKYKVWPTYDFNTPIVDSMEGITDAMRSKEYELRDELYYRILDLLGLRKPKIRTIARLEIKNNITSKRKTNEFIKQGLLEGYDDPRLITIAGLRRHGVQPQAIKAFVLRFGMSKTNSEVGMEMLLAENRSVIDPIAKHLFFVKDPVALKVEGAKETETKIRLHPTKDIGYRELKTGRLFYISGEDAEQLKAGEIIRLKDLLGAKVSAKKKGEVVAEMLQTQKEGRVIQWVPEKHYVECSVLVPGDLIDSEGNFRKDSMKVVRGYAEVHASTLEEHEIVQFERFGYCVLDNKKKMQFIFISR